MKRRFRIYISIFTILFIYSCTNDIKKEVQNENKLLLSISDPVLSFPIDENTSNQVYTLSPYVEKGNHYLAMLNSYQNSVDIYDMKSSEKKWEIVAQKEGPCGIGDITGFHIQSLDSIYVTSKKPYLYIYNRVGEQIGKINYSNTDKGKVRDRYYSNYLTPLIVKNGMYYLAQRIVGNWSMMTLASLKKQPLCIKLTNSGLANYLDFTFPETAFSSKNVFYSFSRKIFNNQFVYSFSSDHNLFITTDHSSVRTSFCKSMYSKELSTKLDSDMKVGLKQIVKKSTYMQIIPDKYRNVLYRIVRTGYELTKNEDPNKLLKFPKQISIMIIDENYEVVGETLLPKDTYMPFGFVGEDGLYLSINHPENPNFNENKIQFRLLKLQKNEK